MGATAKPEARRRKSLPCSTEQLDALEQGPSDTSVVTGRQAFREPRPIFQGVLFLLGLGQFVPVLLEALEAFGLSSCPPLPGLRCRYHAYKIGFAEDLFAAFVPWFRGYSVLRHVPEAKDRPPLERSMRSRSGAAA
jgi:hypothetical protein